MKQWVKLDRELTEQDVGKRIRTTYSSTQVGTITEVNYSGIYTSNGMMTRGYAKAHAEIEEEVQQPIASTQNITSGYALQHALIYGVDMATVGAPVYWHGDTHAVVRQHREWLRQRNGTCPGGITPSHDCYLDGHSIVETGTLRSACKHCDRPAEWDRASCSWVLKNANN